MWPFRLPQILRAVLMRPVDNGHTEVEHPWTTVCFTGADIVILNSVATLVSYKNLRE